MSEKEEGGSAFPCEGSGALYPDPGMSLRDYFAGQALAWMLESQKDVSNALKDAADNSYLAADAMLEARK